MLKVVGIEVVEEVDKTSDNILIKHSLEVDKMTSPDSTAGFVTRKAT